MLPSTACSVPDNNMPVLDNFYFALSRGGGSFGAPVILIHGLGSSHLVWPADIRRMARQTMYALDLPGHGKSGGYGKHDVRAYAREIVRFMNLAGLYKVVLVGHSLGAAIALEVAQLEPSRIIGLILISTGIVFQCNEQLLAGIKNPRLLLDGIEWLSENLFGKNIDRKMKEKVVNGLYTVPSATLSADIRACIQYEFAPQPGVYSMPILIIHGSADKIVLSGDAQSLAKNLPNARLVNIPRAGHMVMLEEPEQVSMQISNFLTDFQKADH